MALLTALFGNSKKGSPATSNKVSGFGAAPAQVQQWIIQQLKQAVSANDPNLKAAIDFYGVDEGDFLNNPELAALQAANPNTPMYQRGISAQPHQFQQNAWQAQGNPDFSQEGLAPYLQPYQREQQAMESSLNKGYDTRSNQIRDQFNTLGSRVAPGTASNLQQQLASLEEQRQDALARSAGFLENRQQENAIKLRGQSLGEQIGAGEAIQGYHQQQLNNASGAGRTTNNPLYQQAASINQLFNPLLGGSYGYSQGAIAERPTTRTKLFAALDKGAEKFATAYAGGQ